MSQPTYEDSQALEVFLVSDYALANDGYLRDGTQILRAGLWTDAAPPECAHYFVKLLPNGGLLIHPKADDGTVGESIDDDDP